MLFEGIKFDKADSLRKRLGKIFFILLFFKAMLSLLNFLLFSSFNFVRDLLSNSVWEFVLRLLCVLISVFIVSVFSKSEISRIVVSPTFEKKTDKTLVSIFSLGAIFIAFRFVSLFSLDFGVSYYDAQSFTDWVFLIVALTVFSAFSEELIFRKLIFGGLLPFGEGFALAVSSVVFGLAHRSTGQIFYAVLSGFVLGLLYARTGSILCSIAVHFFHNFVILLQSIAQEYLSAKQAGIICFAVELLVILAGAFSLLYLVLRQRKNNIKGNKRRPFEEKNGYTLKEYGRGIVSLPAGCYAAYILCEKIFGW